MMTTPLENSMKRESFITVNGKKHRLRDDAWYWLSRFRAARGYTVQQAIEYVLIIGSRIIPINEQVTYQDVADCA